MRKSNDKPNWIVAALVGSLIGLIIFIIGLFMIINIYDDINLAIDTLPSWISAFATVSIAVLTSSIVVLTFFLARETWYLRVAQISQIEELRKESIRPNLEFYLLSAPASFQFLDVHIENNGKGVARNISFNFAGESGEAHTENEKLVIEKFLSLNILKNGMVTLGAGQRRTSFIFSFIELSNTMKDDAFAIRINVTMKYYDNEKREYSSESVLDFSEFKGICEIGGGDPTHNLYKEIEKIRKIFGDAQGNMASKRINVNSFTSQDRKQEQQVIEEWMEKRRKKDS